MKRGGVDSIRDSALGTEVGFCLVREARLLREFRLQESNPANRVEGRERAASAARFLRDISPPLSPHVTKVKKYARKPNR